MLISIFFTLKGRIIQNLYKWIHLMMYHVDKFMSDKNYTADNFPFGRNGNIC